MKKVILSVCALLTFVTGIKAQENKKVFSTPKLSGYGIGQYQYSGQEDAESNTFSLRLVRVSLDGTIFNDFAYRVQGQINGNTSTLGNSPRLVDAYVEWKKYEFIKVKFGQFKLPFTFENPMNPIDQGFFNYSQAVLALSNFSDRTGAVSSNGRDIGLQIQGDLLKTSSGRSLLHYQLGVFNGQGINTKDVDNQKDIVGGFWVMPIEGLRIGAFGWTGSYAREGADGLVKVSKERYAISGEYLVNDWTFRAEYIHSTGFGFKTTYNEKEDLSDATINTANGDKADGFYALAIAPVVKKKLYVKARYDMYRSNGEWNSCKTLYDIGLNYLFNRNVQINASYSLVNDRKLEEHNYSMFDAQISFRF
ncbi:MAG: porin [Prevotellaceae bacterium]|nr:porin [Prevotellaceae bacterium]